MYIKCYCAVLYAEIKQIDKHLIDKLVVYSRKKKYFQHIVLDLKNYLATHLVNRIRIRQIEIYVNNRLVVGIKNRQS